jgi:hypothetical protein
LVKKPKTLSEINQEAEERAKQQRDLIDAYKSAHPGTSVNKMFEPLTSQHPRVFCDPDLEPPEEGRKRVFGDPKLFPPEDDI